MSALVVLLFLCLIQLSMSQNACVWNGRNSSFVNGLYLAAGTSQSGAPSYALQVDASCNVSETLYLFQSIHSVWTISEINDNTDTSDLKGICTSNTAETPSDCNNLWEIPKYKENSDVISYLTDGCPQVLCDGLSMYYDEFIDTEDCIGLFENPVQGYSNAFQKGTSNIYLYFNPSLFRWVCGHNGDIPNNCDTLDNFKGYSVEQDWHNSDLLNSDGEYIKISWSNGYNATISCIANGSRRIFVCSGYLFIVEVVLYFSILL